ncbi:MAG: Rho termination factor N-terminal domain-containing protein [Lachnospiraceae bacterium]
MKTVIKRNVEKIIEDSRVETFLKRGWELTDTNANNKAEDSADKTLDEMTVPELKEIAKGLEIEGYYNLTKPELLKVISDYTDNAKQ